MKIRLLTAGKGHEAFVKEGIDMFTNRISHYHSVEWTIINPPKLAADVAPEVYKKKEGELILAALKNDAVLVLLDERGKNISSEELADKILHYHEAAVKELVFLIGGAYGVSGEVAARANFTWSLSRLVFPHQLVRLILAEQVYRACTINRNEKYHHS